MEDLETTKFIMQMALLQQLMAAMETIRSSMVLHRRLSMLAMVMIQSGSLEMGLSMQELEMIRLLMRQIMRLSIVMSAMIISTTKPNTLTL